MNKEIRIKTLEELINQPREIKFDTYEFDELSYTCLLCDIRMIILENQKLKEKIKKIVEYAYGTDMLVIEYEQLCKIAEVE